ncbi:hypothetical protein ACH61_01904 [Rathayibacter tanaceti]|uniref:Uncharacterized protein n=1 Tax=Rathayibacter tanaceti TaxID=1671680 RepID=A0A162FXH0_9MICO|nr:hypothetical protein ACH61_01904 [Rathayibacter tanaceti]
MLGSRCGPERSGLGRLLRLHRRLEVPRVGVCGLAPELLVAAVVLGVVARGDDLLPDGRLVPGGTRVRPLVDGGSSGLAGSRRGRARGPSVDRLLRGIAEIGCCRRIGGWLGLGQRREGGGRVPGPAGGRVVLGVGGRRLGIVMGLAGWAGRSLGAGQRGPRRNRIRCGEVLHRGCVGLDGFGPLRSLLSGRRLALDRLSGPESDRCRGGHDGGVAPRGRPPPPRPTRRRGCPVRPTAPGRR